MQVRSTLLEKKAFSNQLLGWGITPITHRVLEALFRQSLMASKISEYQYDREVALDVLKSRDISDEVRLKLIFEYVKNWENSLGPGNQDQGPAIYGLEEVGVAAFASHALLIEQYEEACELALKLKNDYSGFADDRIIERLLAEFRDKLKEQVSRDMPPESLRNYLKFSGDGRVERSLHTFDYFKNYIGFALGVFGAFFKVQVVINDDEHGEASGAYNKRGLFNSFLSAKMQYEHRKMNIPSTRFSKVALKDRIKSASKTYSHLAKMPQNTGIVTLDFLKFLKAEQHRKVEEIAEEFNFRSL